MNKNDEPILLESNQNHATIQINGICTTLSASMGLGGGYVPMIVQVIETESEDETDSIFRHNFNSIGSGRREGSTFTNDEST